MHGRSRASSSSNTSSKGRITSRCNHDAAIDAAVPVSSCNTGQHLIEAIPWVKVELALFQRATRAARRQRNKAIAHSTTNTTNASVIQLPAFNCDATIHTTIYTIHTLCIVRFQAAL